MNVRLVREVFVNVRIVSEGFVNVRPVKEGFMNVCVPGKRVSQGLVDPYVPREEGFECVCASRRGLLKMCLRERAL